MNNAPGSADQHSDHWRRLFGRGFVAPPWLPVLTLLTLIPSVHGIELSTLAHTRMVGAGEPGEPLIIGGRVVDRVTGDPVAAAAVQLYHTDAQGEYGQQETRPARLAATVRTDATGRFEVRTIRPGHYPGGGVPAHVHWSVKATGFEERIQETVFENDRYLTDAIRRQVAQPGSLFTLRPLTRTSEGTWRLDEEFLLKPVPTNAAPIQWGGLQPGPHAVGFRVLQTWDHTRRYQFGQPGEETARPLQICVWYPAQQNRGPRYRLADYLRWRATELGGTNQTDAAVQPYRDTLRGQLGQFFAPDQADQQFERALATETAAVWDASPAPGRHPLVIHAFGGLLMQSVMLEYLASHGYVVATFPLLGTRPAFRELGEWNPEAYLTLAGDIAFVRGEMNRRSEVDPGLCAVIGMGAYAGVVHQLAAMDLTAIASLESPYPDGLGDLPGFEEARLRAPIFDLASTGSDAGKGWLDSTRYAPRWAVRLGDLPHGDFYQLRRLARPELATQDVGYEIIARGTLAFLDATVKKRAEAEADLRNLAATLAVPEDFVTLEHRAAQPQVPTRAEFMGLIAGNRVSEATQAWRAARQHDPAYEPFTEGDLIFRALSNQGRFGNDYTLAVLQLLVEARPGSVGAHIRLADAYRGAGQINNARRHYQVALDALKSSPEQSDLRNDLERRLADLPQTDR